MMTHPVNRRYTIKQTIGQGGIGIVFQAYDRLLVHDMENPLMAIQMTTSLLRNLNGQLASEKVEKMVGRIEFLAGQMRELMVELTQDRCMSAAGLVGTQVSPIPLLTLVQNSVAQVEVMAEHKRIQIEVDTNFGSERQVIIDPLLTKLVLVNLLSNAVKYSVPGLSVTLAINLFDQAINIEIVDRGVGLTEHDIASMFTKYAVLSSTPTLGESQNGLGLHNVKLMVESMRGEISAWSAGPGQGTTFQVALPIGLTTSL